MLSFILKPCLDLADERISVIFASRGVCGEQAEYLAAQHKDGVDVREDAVKAEVDVRPDQRKNGGQDAGSRLELRKNTGHA